MKLLLLFPCAFLLLTLLIVSAPPAPAQTTTPKQEATIITLPMATSSDRKLDAGTMAAGKTFHITATGSGDLGAGCYLVNPDGTLHAPAAGIYTYANFGAAYSAAHGGTGINHFAGGGANYDSNGTGFGFAGLETTDTTSQAAIRFGSLVGTFSATPRRKDWFLIGRGGTFTAPATGELYLAVNDSLSSSDQGSYTVILTHAAVPKTSTPVSLGLLLTFCLLLGIGGMAVAAKLEKYGVKRPLIK